MDEGAHQAQRSVAMKPKWRLYILWAALSLAGLLSCAADAHASPSSQRRRRAPKESPLAPAAARSARNGAPRARIRSSFAPLRDVSVTCSATDVVVRVKPSFYGLGADAEELTLGSGCRSNGVLRPPGDVLFTYPLTACGSRRELPRGHLLYKFLLHYAPSPRRSRAHRVDVEIECRYPRNHHVQQLAVKPTWQTAVMRKRLRGGLNDFRIQLMDESWSGPVKSPVYQLGQMVHFQVSAAPLPAGGKLYINSCYAAPSSSSKPSLKYTILDNFGCLLDSERDPGASQFISRTDTTLRLSLKAFQFTSDPDTEVAIHCTLSVTSEAPGPAHKSCTHRGDGWRALAGDDSICSCCDSECTTSKRQRAMMEGSASSGTLLVSDQPHTADEGFLPVSPSVGSTTVDHHADELHGRDDDVWEAGEEEEGEDRGRGIVILREMTEDGLAKYTFTEEDLNDFGEDGSGYGMHRGVEGGVAKPEVHLIQKKGEDALADGRELTWYFKWR